MAQCGATIPRIPARKGLDPSPLARWPGRAANYGRLEPSAEVGGDAFYYFEPLPWSLCLLWSRCSSQRFPRAENSRQRRGRFSSSELWFS